jgi:hypothetical protein
MVVAVVMVAVAVLSLVMEEEMVGWVGLMVAVEAVAVMMGSSISSSRV